MNAVIRPLKNFARRQIEAQRLAAIPPLYCDSRNLPLEPQKVQPTKVHAQCFDVRGAVNPGDQQAIGQLAMGAEHALEIGTHLGGSTLMIAAGALKVTTVDINDVNGPSGAWATHGVPCPRDRLEATGLADKVRFVVQDSVQFLRECREVYDFIFLDGSHDAEVVYREVPLALKVLSPGGVLLLHDVFPNLRPLWADRVVIPGPWLALKRLQDEGAKFRITPLGELPWPTKLGSRVTSLALLSR